MNRDYVKFTDTMKLGQLVWIWQPKVKEWTVFIQPQKEERKREEVSELEKICSRIVPLAKEFKEVRIGGVNFWLKGGRTGGVEEVCGIEYDVPAKDWKVAAILNAVEATSFC